MIALFVTSSFGYGGAEKITVDIANSLANMGHSVHIFSLKNNGGHISSISNDIKVYISPLQRATTSIPTLSKIIRKVKPDFIFTSQHYLISSCYIARLLSGMLKIHIIGREATTPSAEKPPGFKGQLQFKVVSFVYKNVDSLIAPCNFVKKDLINHYQLKKHISVIYNPIDVQSIKSLANEPCPHPWLAQNHSMPVFLAIGRLNPVKNYNFLLECFHRFIKHQAARLIILGDGELRNTLENKIATLNIKDYVSMPGFTDNPFTYLARCNALTLTSHREGYPNVLLQAKVLGVPAISVSCPGGIREILNDSYISPVDNHDAFVENMHKVLTNPNESDIFTNFNNLNTVDEFSLKILKLITNS